MEIPDHYRRRKVPNHFYRGITSKLSRLNTLSQRVADFLKSFPPFSWMEETDLEELSVQVTIFHKSANQHVFKEEELPHPHFYVVHKGAIALIQPWDNQIVDICDEGDLFGLRPLIAGESYKLQAIAQEESILYAIPIATFRPFMEKNHEIGQYLLESFASNTRNPYSDIYKGKLLGDAVKLNTNNTVSKLLDLQNVQYSSDLLTCEEETTVQEVALRMTERNVGSILVVREGLGCGIITDKDIRTKIASGAFPISAEAREIMSNPLITYPVQMTITQAQMAMMKSDISHLVLTEDGTPNTPPIGILSKHDVMLSLGNNPASLVRAIRRSRSAAEIRPLRSGVMNLLQGYLDQNIPMKLISKIISELNDATTKQVIRLALEQSDPPPVNFAWLAMGSQGRSEQMLHTDQDNALIFAGKEGEDPDSHRSYFLELARRITADLKLIGYDFCPADMMASNPKWCMSLSEFRRTTSQWIENPGPNEVLLSSIFFDFNRIYGDKGLVDALTDHLFEEFGSHDSFFMHLAAGALQSPSPTGFFRQFLVEQDGQHKDAFDLKKRVLMPLIDAGRVLVLSKQVRSINNTSDRFEKLATLEPANRELFLSCSYAFRAGLKFRTRQGLMHRDSGRYISLEDLSKEEKMKLKRSFKAVKDIQQLLSVRFMTSRIM